MSEYNSGRVIARFLGSLADVINSDLKKWYVRRKRNLEKVVIKAEQRLAGKNLERVEPKLNVIYPLLEKSSLVDNEIMQKKWSNLLVSSVSKGLSDNVHVSFPSILEQLTPMDAQVLDVLYEIQKDAIPQTVVEKNDVITLLSQQSVSITEEYLNFSLRNLVRLQLCVCPNVDFGQVLQGVAPDTSQYWSGLHITEFGVKFVECCKD